MDKSLQDIAKELHRALEQLNEGALSFEDLAPLVDDAREIYERLIVLRYAAAEHLVKGDYNDRQEVPAFKISANLPGQTSLIDAIEEVVRSNGGSLDREVGPPPLSSEKEGAPPEKVKKGSGTDEEQKKEKEHKTTSSGEQKKNDDKAESQRAKDDDEANDQVKKAPVGSPRGRSQDNSLAGRLRKTPIEDLRKAISLNQKFQLINELFGGDSDSYHLLIDEVNSADSFEQAKVIMGKKSPRLASVDEDDSLAIGLIELVERRFL